jgi:hypothetical protein
LDTAANLVFVGYGITADEYNYDDYRDLNVKDKIVLIYPGEPESDDTTFFEGKKRTTYTSIYKKIDNASKRGVLAVITLSGVEEQFGWESIVSYAKKNIPSVFFFDKKMEDYHRVTDDVNKINFPKIQRISQLVHDLALSAANRESKFKLDL